MEKFGSCVWICENFLFWWGIEFFLFFLFFFIFCVSGSGTLVLRNFFFFGMEIFGHVGFGHGN